MSSWTGVTWTMNRQASSANLTPSLKERAARLRKALKGVPTFGVAEAWRVLGGLRPTAGWTLWQLTDRGVLTRLGRNQYSFQIGRQGLAPKLSEAGEGIRALLQERGLEFLVTGLDVLSPYVLHVSERLPVLVYAVDGSLGEVTDALTRQGWVVILMPEGKRSRDAVKLPSKSSGPIWLYGAAEMRYGQNGLAGPERAFVDLYVAVIRHGYPLAFEDLARLFETIRDRGAFDSGRLTQVAFQRHVAEDVRFLRDYRSISPHAKKLAEYFKEGPARGQSRR